MDALYTPGKFLGLWNNYHSLATKQGLSIPSEPLYFVKTPNSYSRSGAVVLPPIDSEVGRVVFEGELGIVIGRRCVNVDVSQAAKCIAGYTCVNDFTATGLLMRDPAFTQWTRAKSFDGFGAFGPAIVSGLDWRELRVQTLVDGRVRQDYPCADMVFGPEQIVACLSRDMSLEPGDLIACGTSVGVLPLREGSVVDVHIAGIGTLRSFYGQPRDRGLD
jgi:2-keto-4-pentenoate hydratase/2-oxohepta-3-ene-1,7-dioic acid hydratase in catechol pathway